MRFKDTPDYTYLIKLFSPNGEDGENYVDTTCLDWERIGVNTDTVGGPMSIEVTHRTVKN